jgi:hypothetical protein
LDVIRSLLALAAIVPTLAAHAGEIVWESKPARTHLIELYTSEGCSSCLPAEAWMSGLKNEARLWQDFVPVAFHVDYWDHLGWRDPFAMKTWTDRQADYSVRWKAETVYTPAFAFDGKEWHMAAIPPAGADTPGVLKVTVNGDRLTANFKPAQGGARRYDVHVAQLGFALTADVTAGENNGRKLIHDFVVLGLTTETMKAGVKELRLSAPSISSNGEPRTALAVWVSEAGKIEPLQAVGGWRQ